MTEAIQQVRFRGARQNMNGRAIQITAAHLANPDTVPPGFWAGPSRYSGKLVYSGFEDSPVHEGDWLVQHGPDNAPVVFHFDQKAFESFYRPAGISPLATFIDIGAGLERDAKNCVMVLAGLLAAAAGLGALAHYLFFRWFFK